jgi:Flp pilus assembly protein TadG
MQKRSDRRGSTLVMVALMLVCFMGVGAIAADVGRFYVVTSELQTAADAAALEGARTLQKTTAASPEATVDAAVMAFVLQANRADNTQLSVTADSVRMAYWTRGNTNPDFVLNGRRPNAVYVRVKAEPKGVFSQIIGRTARLNLSRPATAWIANLPSNCVRPFAMPYGSLYRRVAGVATSTTPAPDLDQAKFAAFQNLTDAQRMFVILGANTTSTLTNDGAWDGFNFQGNAGRPGFSGGIEGCNSPRIDPDAANGVTLPGSNPITTWADEAIAGGGTGGNTYPGICKMRAGNAGCFASDTSTVPGVVINSVWGEILGTGSNAVDFRYVGEFTMTCWYRNSTDSCPVQKPGAPATGYPRGTIVGFVNKLKPRFITPEDILGNVLSNNQRLILVK